MGLKIAFVVGQICRARWGLWIVPFGVYGSIKQVNQIKHCRNMWGMDK